MHPLVAIEEPEYLAAQPERHYLGGPCESHPRAAHASCGKDDGLLERPERHWHLEHDPAILELASGSKMRAGAVAQRLDDHLVLSGTREPAQDAPGLGVCQPGQLAADDHAQEYASEPGPPAWGV